MVRYAALQEGNLKKGNVYLCQTKQAAATKSLPNKKKTIKAKILQTVFWGDLLVHESIGFQNLELILVREIQNIFKSKTC